jgi:phosphatidylglycerophosphate synthase
VQTPNGTIRVAISADESADWHVCGLRQIDRIRRALDDFERTSGRTIALTGEQANADLALSTRVVLARGSLAERLNGNPNAGRLLANREDIPAAEKWLARDLGKPQDGWVARHIDRRISTAITRALLRRGVLPWHATLGAFFFALIGSAILLRGDHASVIAGTLCFYLFSILDGCDGEIARALYLDSEAGARLDFVFDTIANVLFVISLGVGLHLRWEGIATGMLIVASELMLATGKDEIMTARHSGMYDRHVRMLGHSGAFIFGERIVHFVVQATKRDVAWLAFVALAVLGAARWILHLSLATALLTTTLAALAIIRRPAPDSPSPAATSAT